MLTAYLGFAFDEVGVALGVTLLASFILAMAAITRPVRKTHLLIALNWTLVVNMSILVGVSTSLGRGMCVTC